MPILLPSVSLTYPQGNKVNYLEKCWFFRILKTKRKHFKISLNEIAISSKQFPYSYNFFLPNAFWAQFSWSFMASYVIWYNSQENEFWNKRRVWATVWHISLTRLTADFHEPQFSDRQDLFHKSDKGIKQDHEFKELRLAQYRTWHMVTAKKC